MTDNSQLAGQEDTALEDEIFTLEEQLKSVGILPEDLYAKEVWKATGTADLSLAYELEVAFRPILLELTTVRDNHELLYSELKKLDKDAEDVLKQFAKKIRLFSEKSDEISSQVETLAARVTALEIHQKKFGITPQRLVAALVVFVLTAHPGLVAVAWHSLEQIWHPAVVHKAALKKAQHRSHPH